MELDRTPGYVNQLSNAIDGLAAAMNSAAKASDRHARGLVYATWALFGATAVLVIVTGVHLYYTLAK